MITTNLPMFLCPIIQGYPFAHGPPKKNKKKSNSMIAFDKTSRALYECSLFTSPDLSGAKLQ
jgi:hypothetical protein